MDLSGHICHLHKSVSESSRSGCLPEGKVCEQLLKTIRLPAGTCAGQQAYCMLLPWSRLARSVPIVLCNVLPAATISATVMATSIRR